MIADVGPGLPPDVARLPSSTDWLRLAFVCLRVAVHGFFALRRDMRTRAMQRALRQGGMLWVRSSLECFALVRLVDA